MRFGRRAARGWAGYKPSRLSGCLLDGGFPLLMAGGSDGVDIGDAVNYSVRFNSADTPLLSKAFVTPTSVNIYTLSLWYKRSSLGTAQRLFGASTNHSIGFNASDQLVLTINGTSYTSTDVFRDVAKHYHFVYTQNGTTYTIYVGDPSQTSGYRTVRTGTSVANTAFNTNAVVHQIGAANSADYLNGYLADVCFVDGVAHLPTAFGRLSADTGAWVHKNPSGLTWGANGFRLQFNTGAVASDLGTDTSGNGNTFTVTNLSVTAGAGNDWLTDTPTNTYATLNPLQFSSGAPADGALSSNGATYVTGSTIIPASGKWKAEATVTSGTSTNIGVLQANPTLSGTTYLGLADTTNKNCSYRSLGNGKIVNGVATGGVGASYTTNDTITVELDMDANPPTASFYKNTGALEFTQTLTAGFQYQFASSTDGGAGTVVWNFGQRAFTRTPSTGFLALCTANLPTPAIGATAATLATKHFDIRLRAGTAAVYSVTGIGFQPDLVWVKSRGRSLDHAIYDSVRGVQKQIESNALSNETTEAAGLTAFNSDGYTGGALDQMNGTTATNSFIDWMWKGGGAAVSNTSGTITSSVSANTIAGISIGTYTGTAVNASVGHGLGVAPKMVITYSRSNGSGENKAVWHTGLTGGTYYVNLNSTAGQVNDSARFNGSPSSTVFNIGANSQTNGSGYTFGFIAFAEVEGFSKIGSYAGNGSADGPCVWCGFRPRYILIKNISTSLYWMIFDTARNTYNVATLGLDPSNLYSASELTLAAALDITSSGFKVRTTDGNVNTSGHTMIFAAFAEMPFKFSNAR